MYSTLDGTDTRLKPGPDGRRWYVQTDHRSANEIAQEPEISALFALIRILNPKREATAGELEPKVQYSIRERPPEFLCQVIHAAGGEVVIRANLEPEPVLSPVPPLAEVIEKAVAGVARLVTAEYGLSPTLRDLKAVEAKLVEAGGDPEEDEPTYWTAIMKLACFAGEVVRAKKGGQWVVSDDGYIPLALSTNHQGGKSIIYLMDRATNRFVNGEKASVVFLVESFLSKP